MLRVFEFSFDFSCMILLLCVFWCCYRWSGSGVAEVGTDVATGKVVVRVDPQYYRPTEVELLLGNPAKIKKQLGWSEKVQFEVSKHNICIISEIICVYGRLRLRLRIGLDCRMTPWDTRLGHVMFHRDISVFGALYVNCCVCRIWCAKWLKLIWLPLMINISNGKLAHREMKQCFQFNLWGGLASSSADRRCA